MKRLCVVFALCVGLVLAACGAPPPPAATATPVDGRDVLNQVIANLRKVNTFKLLVEQLGADYFFYVSLDEGKSSLKASMRRAEAQYVNPDAMYANVTLRLDPLPPVGVEIFARGLAQWFRLANAFWVEYPIAEGFDPRHLIQEESGFSEALNALRDLEYLGMTTLIDGMSVQHIRGRATGEVINELMFNLLDVQSDNVLVDVFINPLNLLPAKLLVTVLETATSPQERDTQWSVEIYDYGAEPNFPLPPDVTLESQPQGSN